jgi:hypothetical protein
MLDERTVEPRRTPKQVVVQPVTRLTGGRTVITTTHQPTMTALATSSPLLRHPRRTTSTRPYQVAEIP